MAYAESYPFDLLADWLAEAEASEVNDPNAVYLATVDADGQPSVRTVLLKGLEAPRLKFYTNTLSRKGRNMAGQSRVALLFHWKSLRRQVRVEGQVARVSDAEADAYFATRPRTSQIGAHASLQSQPLDRRQTLENRVRDLEQQYAGQEVPRPPHWSGYGLRPQQFEFWREGAFRLHDREVLTPTAAGWAGQRLFP